MPIDAILVSAAVMSVFVVFAGVLFWGDFQSQPAQTQHISRKKRRAF